MSAGRRFRVATRHNTSFSVIKNKNKKFRPFKTKENIYKKEKWAIQWFRLIKSHK